MNDYSITAQDDNDNRRMPDSFISYAINTELDIKPQIIRFIKQCLAEQ